MSLAFPVMLFGCALLGAQSPRVLYVDDFDLSSSSCGFGRKTQTRRTVDGHAFSVWVRPLTGGFKAVALVNRSPIARETRLTFKEIGLGGVCYVKDLWRQKCEGKHVGYYAALVPPHATKLVKTRPVDCEKCE